jgi:outer membrane protein assembly factor BamB
VVAFDPTNGDLLWQCKGLNPLVYTSPIYSEGIVLALGGYSGSALAVKAGGAGDVTETHRLWHKPKTPQRIGSAVIHGDHYYILNDKGVAQCFELKTGKEIWEERLRGKAKTSQNWSSLVLSEGKLFAVNQGGDAFVFRASPEFELLTTNALGEKVIGSMAVSDGDIFIRGHKNLWCIGKP